MSSKDYIYSGTVIRWVDGDTVDIDVDLGFSIWSKQRFRLKGINTPEKNKPGCNEARLFAESKLPATSSCELHCYGKDKYGRWLATIFISKSSTKSVNEMILEAKLAVPFMVD